MAEKRKEISTTGKIAKIMFLVQNVYKALAALAMTSAKRLDALVFSDKDDKLYALSLVFSLLWLAEDVTEPTHLLQRVEHEVHSVVVWSCTVTEAGVGNAWRY